MIYLILVPDGAYRISKTTFAIESAFCIHLHELKAMLAPRFPSFSFNLVAVDMSKEEYERKKDYLAVIDEERDQTFLTTLYGQDNSTLQFWLFKFLPSLVTLYQLVCKSDLVHSTYSHNLWRPIEFPSLLFGVLMRKKTISVTDIDLRNDAWMLFQLKKWSLKSYLICKYIYDPIRNLQHKFIVQYCSLVLFKEKLLCEDYGLNKSNVKFILDPGFSQDEIISDRALEIKVNTLKNPAHPLELIYFGRLTDYKGVDRCIKALALVKAKGEYNVRFNIMGQGEEAENLRKLTKDLDLQELVIFHEPISYGTAFFEKIRQFHLMLAAPLSADTPRSTWDAIASGIPLLAFDTAFYKSIAAYTGVVDLVPWPSIEDLATRINYYCRHKDNLIPLVFKAVEIARNNTQFSWLHKRVNWTNELFDSN